MTCNSNNVALKLNKKIHFSFQKIPIAAGSSQTPKHIPAWRPLRAVPPEASHALCPSASTRHGQRADGAEGNFQNKSRKAATVNIQWSHCIYVTGQFIFPFFFLLLVQCATITLWPSSTPWAVGKMVRSPNHPLCVNCLPDASGSQTLHSVFGAKI